MQGLLGAAVITATPIEAYANQSKTTDAWPADALHNASRPQLLNAGWRFHHGDAEGASASDFNDASWRSVTVPHDWSIEDLPAPPLCMPGTIWAQDDRPVRVGPFDMYGSAGQTATGWTVGGVGWYRKTLDLPHAPAGGQVELRFEGVYMDSDVWINGAHLGNHPYGYTEFAYDVTEHLKPGANILALKVNNAGRNSRWYSGSGIFRKVWLRVRGEQSIATHGVFVWTQSATADAAQLKVEATVDNRASRPRTVQVAARLVDDQGLHHASPAHRLSVAANGSAVALIALEVQHPRLWSSENPRLCRVEVVVHEGDKVLDTAQVSTGIRTVEISAAQGLRINGESIKLRGGCLHNDNGPVGSACIPRAEERRIELLKANGYLGVPLVAGFLTRFVLIRPKGSGAGHALSRASAL